MKEVTALEAFELMKQNPDCIYLDVRSIAEFEKGHPVGSMNIPLLHFAPGMGMYPNDDFIAVADANLSKDANILIGCRTGARSAQACEILSGIGFRNVTNVRGGFVGVADAFGQVIEPGWSLQNLPVCQECPENDRYQSLAAKAGK